MQECIILVYDPPCDKGRCWGPLVVQEVTRTISASIRPPDTPPLSRLIQDPGFLTVSTFPN